MSDGNSEELLLLLSLPLPPTSTGWCGWEREEVAGGGGGCDEDDNNNNNDDDVGSPSEGVADVTELMSAPN